MIPVYLTLPSYGPHLGDIIELARTAEANGVDGIVLPDHVVMGTDTSSYPFGTFPYPPDVPWLEPLTTLAAIAGATSRIRLSTGILVAPVRPAALLAKTVATLDVLCGGRLDLAVGTGWQRSEFEALGVAYDDRGPLLDRSLATCRAMWGDNEPVDGVWCRPQPAQSRLPVLIAGGLHGRTIERIVAWGDGWVPLPRAPGEEIEAALPPLREAWAAAGHEPGALRVRGRLAAIDHDGVVDFAATLAGRDALAAAGCTECVLTLRTPDAIRSLVVTA